jgi:uncharacterized protein DUF11
MSCSSKESSVTTSIQVLDCLQTEIVTLERVNYFDRQLLTADDMITERDYFLQKLRRHNRFLHGWGVVCGLGVTAAPTSALPWRVQIGTGYALGPYGDEIYVAQPVYLDLAKCGPGATTDPCEPGLLHPGKGGVGARVYVAIKYAECMARPVRAMPAGCGCDDDPCEYSRIRDSFQVQCLTKIPPASPPGPSLCDILRRKVVVPCPVCPEDPWVVLAVVTLPSSPSTNIVNSNIDNISVRRLVFSTAVLQDQLIRCCCGGSSSSSSSSSSSFSLPVADVSVDQSAVALQVPASLENVAGLTQVTVTVRNNGPAPADNVQLKVIVTAHADPRFFSIAGGAGATVTGNVITSSLGLMTPNSSLQRQYTITRTKRLLQAVPCISAAEVVSSTSDPNPANNNSSINFNA